MVGYRDALFQSGKGLACVEKMMNTHCKCLFKNATIVHGPFEHKGKAQMLYHYLNELT